MEVGCRTRIPALTVVRRTPKISSSFFPNISSYVTIYQAVHIAVNGSYVSFHLSLKDDPKLWPKTLLSPEKGRQALVR